MSILQKISDYGETLETLKDNEEINEHNYMELFNNLRDIRDLYKDSRFVALYCIYSNTYSSDTDETICSTINHKRILTRNTIPEQSVEIIRDSLQDPVPKFALTFRTGPSEFYNIYKMVEY